MKKADSLADSHTELDSRGLLDLVRRGDIQSVRRYFDGGVKGRTLTKPGWSHLRCALEQQNPAMTKLLVTWGARPAPEELADFLRARGDRAENDIKRLKLAGLRLADLAAAKRNASFKKASAPPVAPDPAKIPDEWKKMLQAVQDAGAPEAVIAGGCLSDLYNGREVKSVDIFLKSPMFLQKKFLNKAMKASGLTLYTYGTFRESHFTSSHKMADTNSSYDKADTDLGHVRTWQGKAHWPAIEFNFIFMSSPLADDMRRDCGQQGKEPRRVTQQKFLHRLDVGLCQILFDGTNVITTDAYQKDSAECRLTLRQPQHTSLAHLRRVAEKYPSHAPCDAFSKALETGRIPAPKSSHGYYVAMSYGIIGI